jgi:hypothetical protein
MLNEYPCEASSRARVFALRHAVLECRRHARHGKREYCAAPPAKRRNLSENARLMEQKIPPGRQRPEYHPALFAV